MLERPDTGERAVLVRLELPLDDAGDGGVEEFRELAASAGVAETAMISGARSAPDPRFFAGSGKVEEIRESVVHTGADVVIFDHALAPAQERNLERALQCRVVDRIGLILDLFAQRARTFEGKLQVELAQLDHLSTRLVRGWTHLERQKGGIGLRGPGEKQLETDRRLLSERVRQIRRRLEGVRTRRELSRRARRRTATPVVSLVGYTNAGKSTLFNRLTGAGVRTEDRLFATLDPTLRRMELHGAPAVVIADTVGFIRNLPTELVAAFRATLEETRDASLLLHVIDAHAPDRDAKCATVRDVLERIGAGEVPQIEVYNKIDTAANGASADRARVDRGPGGRTRVWLSARTGEGVDGLAEAIAGHFRDALVRRRVRVPAGAGRLRARLFEIGAVLEERRADNGDSLMSIAVAPSTLARLCRREGLATCLVNDDAGVAQDASPVAGHPGDT